MIKKQYIVQMSGFDSLKVDSFSEKDIILYLMSYCGQKDTIYYKAIKSFSDMHDMIEMFEAATDETILFILEINKSNIIYQNNSSSSDDWNIVLDEDGNVIREN